MSTVIGQGIIEVSADATKLTAGIDKAKRSIDDLGDSGQQAGKKAADGIKKSQQAIDAYVKKLQFRASAIGKTASELKLMELAERGATKAQIESAKAALQALDSYKQQQTAAREAALIATVSANGYRNAGLSAKEMSFALRNIPAQFTDIAVSLQAGQNPLTVFLQQGGQLKDMFGGIGPAARAMGGYIAGLINPLTVSAAAFGVLAYAYARGSREADAYNKALILSGNAIGLTADKLDAMAQRLDDVTGTQSAAAAALVQFAGSNGIAADNIERFTAVALKMEKLTGQAVKDTVAQFAELGKEPVAASIKLNDSTHFLTATLYQQIKALEEQGKTADAAALAQNAYADAQEKRNAEIEAGLGGIERAWNKITDEAKKAWDAMLGIGRQQSVSEQIAAIQSQIDGIDKRKSANPQDQQLRSALVVQQMILESKQRQQVVDADAERRNAKQASAMIEFDKLRDQYLDKRLQMEREIAEARKAGTAAGESPQAIDKVIAGIRDKYADKGAVSASRQQDKSTLGFDISAIRHAREQLQGVYDNAEKIMQARRNANLITEREYYAAKQAFVRLDAQAQETALQAEISRLQQEKLTGKDKIDNQRQIADAQAKLAKVRADAAASSETLAVQEEAANKKTARSYDDMRIAAQSYLDTLNKQYARQLEGIGRGAQYRDRQSGLSQIDDRYESQRQNLERDKRNGLITDERYQNELATIEEFHAKAKQSYDKYYDSLEQSQRNWVNGASEGMNNYLDTVRNISAQTESLVSNAFKGMENALVNFTMTGKLSFADMAKSIIAGLIRIQIQKAITGIVGSLFGGSNLGAGSTGSGTMSSLQSYGVFHTGGIVGSETPSLRMLGGFPSSAPRYHTGGIAGDEVPAILQRGEGVFTREQMRSLAPVSASGGNVSVNVSVDASGTSAEGNGAQANQLGQMIGAAVRNVIVQEKRPGGMLAA